jgi:hypothetical protein
VCHRMILRLTLFLFYVHDLLINLKKIKIVLFADNANILGAAENIKG